MTRNTVAAIMLVASSTLVAAQQAPRYDRESEKAISGTIKAVVSFPAPDGGVGVHLDLNTPEGLVSVHVAPALFIGQKNFWFFADDRLQIVGTRVEIDGNVAIWAKAIQKGSETLVLRTAEGAAKWTPAGDGIDGCGVNHLAIQRGTER